MALPAAIKALGIIERDALADGDVIVWDAGRGAFVSKRPTVWVKQIALASSIATTTPDFVGQLLVEMEGYGLYVAVALTAGQWEQIAAAQP